MGKKGEKEGIIYTNCTIQCDKSLLTLLIAVPLPSLFFLSSVRGEVEVEGESIIVCYLIPI